MQPVRRVLDLPQPISSRHPANPLQELRAGGQDSVSHCVIPQCLMPLQRGLTTGQRVRQPQVCHNGVEKD